MGFLYYSYDDDIIGKDKLMNKQQMMLMMMMIITMIGLEIFILITKYFAFRLKKRCTSSVELFIISFKFVFLLSLSLFFVHLKQSTTGFDIN
jgi:hypothetical protein